MFLLGLLFVFLTIFSTLPRPIRVATLHLGEQATPVAGDHGVEVVERRVHVDGPHAIDVTVGRGEGLDP